MYCITYVIANFALIIGVKIDYFDNLRIVKGNSTTISNHPHMVSIEINKTHACGGSLIKANIVLTAGHCLGDFDLSWFTVRVGTGVAMYGGQTSRIVKTSVHPKYINNVTAMIMDYDVGVAKLHRSFILHSYVKIIQLQPKGVKVPDKSIGTVAGWGALQERLENKVYPVILQELNASKINQEVCEVTSILIVTDRFTCYGSGILGPKGFCRGDSGSAIVVDGKQVGIVSATLGCGLPLFFHNLYTSIENEEIRNHIDQSISEFDKN